MSSRAFRRLNRARDADVIRLGLGSRQDSEEEEDEEVPVFQPRNKKKGRSKGFVQPVQDPFEVLVGENEVEEEEEEEEVQDEEKEEAERETATAATSGSTKQKKHKKKKKKSKKEQVTDTKMKEEKEGADEVDAAIRQVNELLGEVDTTGGAAAVNVSDTSRKSVPHHILSIDRRCLNAENEMRRIFGSRVVREHTQRKTHRKRYQRPTILATPTDSWPKMEKLGLSMQLVEVKDGCSHFVFEHSGDYQKVQFDFWDAVETYDPNSIAAVLHAHPYHIDSLLQLSEVCKMGDDTQMAADLIERALYCFESSFHPLFNYTQANCRLDYCQTENRSFYLTLFRHLNYIGRKGCHRTALEFCKLLLSLNPDKDPLCVLLLIDYYAVRSYEYEFLINLFSAWEPHRNLSQLPNFAFSVPLATFHSSKRKREEEEEVEKLSRQADRQLQDALIMFPSLLLPLMDKCGVMLDPVIMTHSHFTSRPSNRDPQALQLLTKLYIERAHSLWKEPEVLTWLEANARVVVTRADSGDPLIKQCDEKRKIRYIGTPRNIYRHVIVSDLESVTGSLPRDVTGTPIMMYDPLPPDNSIAGYKRPPKTRPSLAENEDYFSLFLRSLLPSFNMAGDTGSTQGQVQVEGVPQHPVEGAVGGGEGGVSLEAAVGQLTHSLRGLLDQLRVVLERPVDDDNEREQDSDDDDR